MGLLGFYIGYRKGRRAERRRSSSSSFFDDVAGEVADDEVCQNCGYEARQHSDEGDCPNYG